LYIEYKKGIFFSSGRDKLPGVLQNGFKYWKMANLKALYKYDEQNFYVPDETLANRRVSNLDPHNFAGFGSALQACGPGSGFYLPRRNFF
jgi:hypothetical protein